MGFLGDAGRKWYESRKGLARHATAAWREWFKGGGKEQLKALGSGAFGELWARYGDISLEVVRGLRDKSIPLLDGEDYRAAFVRALVDRNQDGRISLADLPARWVDRLQQVAVGAVEAVDGPWGPAVEATRRLFEALKGE